MSAPEALINSLYRAGNIGTKDIQSILSTFQSIPKQVDEDIDIELNLYDTEVRDRIESHLINPGPGARNKTRDRDGGHGYFRKIPSQVNIYPLIHTINGTGTIISTGKKFTGGLQTDGTYYQSVGDKTRLNPTTEIGIVGWLKIPSGVTSGKIVSKSTQYNLEVTAANTISWNVNSKTPVTMTFPDDTWFHFGATYKSTASGQKIYDDAVLADSDSETGSITTSSNDLGILANSNGSTKLGANSIIAHLTMLSKEPNASWITDHKNGILNTETYTEIFTIPFVAHDRPKSDCSVGRCKIS